MGTGRITIDRGQLDGLLQGLKVIQTPDFLGRNIDIEAIKRSALTKLKDEFFPYSETARKTAPEYRGHLRTGWRAFDFSQTDGVGFTIRNVMASENPRIQTILASLDKGSRGYIRELNGKKALSFVGKQGRATRPNSTYAPYVFTSRHIYIPARRPINYIEKTYRYIDDLIAAKFPDYVRGVRQDLRRRTNSI